MAYSQRKILVTGATGQQGGALARQLLQKKHKVYALTRNTHSPAAQDLHDKGANIIKGDLDDYDSLIRVVNDVESIFLMGTPFEDGTEGEIRRGKLMADIAKDKGIEHLVYSSVANADKNTGIPHFDSKREVEKHIEGLGIPYTIVAPVYFMDNLLAPWTLPQLKEGRFPMALPASRPLQQIALSDIVAFTALVLENREQFVGRRVDIASDEPSGKEVADVLTRVTGREIGYVELPLEQVRQAMGEDGAGMFEWFARVGYSADIEGLRSEHPEVGWHAFEDWDKEQNW